MPYGDGILKINCYSLTDFHDFESCSFKFFVKHHLDKKYEIEEGNEAIALGTLLDLSIKLFHKTRAYGVEVDYLKNIVQAALREVREQVERKPGPSFYSAMMPFLTPELVDKAISIFQNYYKKLGGKIKRSIMDVGFCEWIISTDNAKYKIWGGPDTIEMGDDDIPEIVDYKSRENIEKGKMYMDMDLMPKVYTLLCSKKLLDKGFDKARFVVRFWQDPEENSFQEEFDLSEVIKYEDLLKQKIERILSIAEFKFCNRSFCSACNSDKKDEYLLELEKLGLKALMVENNFKSDNLESESLYS